MTEKIRGMSDADIEQLLSKGENESPLTVIDEVPIETEDVHIVYRVAKQTRFEATAEKGVGLSLSVDLHLFTSSLHSLLFYSITPPMIR